jgi:hypothetical protein
VSEPAPTPPTPPTAPPPAAPAPPDASLVKPAWILIFVGWAILLLPIPFTGWIGWMVGCVAASVLAVFNLARGLVGVGLAQLACAVVGSFVFYWIGLTILAGIAVSVLSG